MNETQMYCSTLKKAERMRFKKHMANSLWLVAILACSLLLIACSKTEEPAPVVIEEESALSVPFTNGPSNPPAVNPPTSNPPSN